MIIGLIHKGSGLGDQLFSYIATRVRAADLGVDFGFVGKEFFKGASFMDLDWGKDSGLEYHIEEPSGKLVIDDYYAFRANFNVYEFNKSFFDPEFNFIPDGWLIDGYGAQDIRYWGHRLGEIKEWLKVLYPLLTEVDVSIVNIRGGEYRGVPELFLPREYWEEAILRMDKKIVIHTDDLQLADEWFPDTLAFRDIALNWRALRYAKYAIISNSAFAIIPRLLKHLEDPEAVTIAPKYWAGRNVGEWRRPQNYYKEFIYI